MSATEAVGVVVVADCAGVAGTADVAALLPAGCAGIAGTAGVATITGVVVADWITVVDEVFTIGGEDEEDTDVVSGFFSIPGAVTNPDWTAPETPGPSVANSFNFCKVLGPTAPTDSSPCFSCNLFTAASVRGPK